MKKKLTKKRLLFLLIFLYYVWYVSFYNKSNNTDDTTISAGNEVEQVIELNNNDKNSLIENEINKNNESLNEKTVKDKNEGIRDTTLNGRGHSDSGRSEPNYENVIGYVVISNSSSNTESLLETPWTVPTYEKDKQFYIENGTIDHKTEVIVKSQELKHEGYGAYSGYLLVERLDNNESFFIDAYNFITKPYWSYDNLDDAVLIGTYIAEYNQVSDLYPVDKNNNKVELDNGIKILVTGKTGLYGRGGPDYNTHSIEAVVFKEWKYGYGGVSVFFNTQDLSIVY